MDVSNICYYLLYQIVYKSSLVGSPHVSPVCLPARSQDFTGRRCWITGWGKDGFGEEGQYQSILKVRGAKIFFFGIYVILKSDNIDIIYISVFFIHELDITETKY